jgi:hypothetical protein
MSTFMKQADPAVCYASIARNAGSEGLQRLRIRSPDRIFILEITEGIFIKFDTGRV